MGVTWTKQLDCFDTVPYDCTRCWQPRESAKTRHKGTIHETAAALAVAIERKHPDCQHAAATAAAAPAIKRTLEESDEDLSRANKRVRAAESRSAELQRQLDAAAVDKAAFENQQSLDAKAAKRRAVHIDSDNQEQWDLTMDKEKHQKGNAMNAPMTGVLVCMRYWCRGSIGKLLQIVLTLVSQFRLEDGASAERASGASCYQTARQRLHRLPAELRTAGAERGSN